jgi:hypothetical protein
MSFDFPDYVLLQDLPLKALEGVLKRLALLEPYLSQIAPPTLSGFRSGVRDGTFSINCCFIILSKSTCFGLPIPGSDVAERRSTQLQHDSIHHGHFDGAGASCVGMRWEASSSNRRTSIVRIPPTCFKQVPPARADSIGYHCGNMLELDDPRWAEPRHAYGFASDIPGLLRQLRRRRSAINSVIWKVFSL